MNMRCLLAIVVGFGAVSAPVVGAQDAAATADRLVALVEALQDAPASLDAVRQTAHAVAAKRDDVALAADAERQAFFERRVWSVLQSNCVECHGPETQKSGLRVDSLAGLLQGGERGAAVVPGDAEASRLIQAVRREGELKMPPEDHPALDTRDAWALAEWVRLGARWPGQAGPPAEGLLAQVERDDQVVDSATAAAARVPSAGDTERTALTRAVVSATPPNAAQAAESTVDFDQDIRPILSNHCFACHGFDAEARKAGLRLDDQEIVFKALESGAVPVVAGNPEASAVYQKISAADPAHRMPPADFDKPLSAEQVALIKQWIAEGAPWKSHWSFVAPERPEPPAVADTTWLKNPIDQFIAARLEKEGLKPSPEADRARLLRRITYDLTGLPPTVEELEAFENDPAPDAYERAIERLFASPRYGEHMARHWLDLARYADTNGYHIDNERYMWRWRDWVIQAFNENKPYDDFTVEQLAGDLLPDATLEQKIATGFNRNHMINFEGGAIPEEYQAAYVKDRVDTTSTVWLGLTMKCAECHDHKYDPITQREFYQMYALFNTVPEQGLDGREGNATPFLKAPLPEQESQLAALDNEIARLKAELAAPDEATDAAQAQWEADWAATLEEKWAVVTPQSAESAEGATLTVQADGSVLASGENPAQDTYTIIAPAGGIGITAIRLEALTDASLPHGSAGRADNGNFVLTDFAIEIASASTPDQWEKVGFLDAQADFSQEKFPVELAVDNSVRTGWAVEGQTRREDRTARFVTERPMGFADGTLIKATLRFRSEFEQHSIGRLRLAVTRDTAMAPATNGEWYINGPYVAASGDEAYKNAYEPESQIDLASTYADGRMKWVRVLPGFADGELHPLPGEVAATYLYRTITAPTAREAVLSLGSNDAIKMWLNGEVAHDNNAQRQAELDQDKVTVRLKEGKNDLLLKVVNYGNAYAFSYRVAEQQFGVVPLETEALLAKAPEKRSEAETAELRRYYRTNHVDAYRELSAKLAGAEAERATVEAEAPTTMVMAAMAEPRETHILMRGQYDQFGDKVEPGTPAALPPMPENVPRNRLGFAEWLVSPEHPLTARVTVNRLWQQVFGHGLVKTSEDFGIQGSRPSHPELLDWLAVEFVESGWDMQHMLRLMLTSATYRQDSRLTPELREHDPQNRLLARGPRLRLDAEAIRDTALAASGLLVEKFGGPSVRPYQPEGIWEEVAYGAGYSAQVFELGKGDELYRRSLYTFWKRQAPPPSLVLFDAPNRETCTAQRARTNTPLQALNLLNGTQYVEAARALAARVIEQGGTAVDEKLNYAYRLATSRVAGERERAALRELLELQREAFQQDQDAATALLAVGAWKAPESCDTAELAAWTAVASVLLNLDETITKS